MLRLCVQLVHQEEELRREEEAYYQAVRAEAAARLGRVQRRKEKLQRLIAARNDPNKWLGENDSDWEMYVRSTATYTFPRFLESPGFLLLKIP